MTLRIDRSRLRSIAVLDEDDELLVVAKPAGMAVHGGAGETGRTVLELLEEAYVPRMALHLVHRLDKDTSGVMVVAKTRETAKKLGQIWDTAEKTYVAVVKGAYRGPMRIDRPLPDDDGISRPAATRIEVLAVMEAIQPATSLIRASIETGRTHQIRRHLADVSSPVMLDDKHGDFAANKAWVRAIKEAGVRAPHKADLMLHAWRLALGDRKWTSAMPAIWGPVLKLAGASDEALAT